VASYDEDFAAFVNGSRQRWCRVAYLVCGDWHQAEDIVQTALAQVYARWSAVDRREGPDGYVRRAVVNAAIDESRRPWRREHPADLVPDRPVPVDDGITPRVLEALTILPPGQRAVVVLRFIEDLDVEATARLLGLSTGTVKSQTAKGLAALRLVFQAGRLDVGEVA
jgi:RNA polymerase sigma-70 factor (sigma-E family)